jgi:hypothetical protein
MARKKKFPNGRRKARLKTPLEVERLRQELAEARLHRDLLIHTLHRFSTAAAGLGGTLPSAAAPSVDVVLAWLLDEVAGLTSSRPILRSSKLSDLRVPLPRLTKDVNEKWFPNGGGFASIDGETTIGNLAYAITERLQG